MVLNWPPLPFWNSKPKLGEGCKPGQAEEGTVVHYVEDLIQKRIRNHPDEVKEIDLIENYVKSLDIVKKSGQDPCLRWLANCTHHYKPQASPSLAMSIASGTSDGGIGPSPSSSNVGSQNSSSASGSIDAADETVRYLFIHSLL